MLIINRLLFKLTAFCRCRIINGPDEKPYLERYRLFGLPFGIQVYIHRFVAGDPGRGLHNHPWNSALSLLLCGQYEEVRMSDANDQHRLRSRIIGAGRLNWINGRVFHRINLIDESECWTLFVHGRKAKSWGFLQKQRQQFAFHDHKQILNQASNGQWWKTVQRPAQNPSMRKMQYSSSDSCAKI